MKLSVNYTYVDFSDMQWMDFKLKSLQPMFTGIIYIIPIVCINVCAHSCDGGKYCVTLIVHTLTLCSTAITFTTQLASDYLCLTHGYSNAHRHTNTA